MASSTSTERFSPVTDHAGLDRGVVPGTHSGALQGAHSAVAWGAILAGAAAAAALSLILLILGTGLGLSSVSPWAQAGLGATAFGVSTILWLTLTQLLASGMGGYLAGRLRTRWLSVHSDEVYFRDTAHGFLAWAIASLATAAMLGSAVSSIVGTGVQAGASMGGGAAAAATGGAATAMAGERDMAGSGSAVSAYTVDTLFRKNMAAATEAPVAPAAASADTAASSAATTVASATAAPIDPSGGSPSADATPPAAAVGEVTRILANGLRQGALPADDTRYVAQLVARHTGLSQQDAEKRVADSQARMQARLAEAETTARSAADTARKASATAALWLFVSLLAGAFVASFAATIGGRQRDT